MLKGELHPNPKLSIFCALSHNYQHGFEKWDKDLEANCLKNSKIALQFQLAKRYIYSCVIKHAKYCCGR